MCAPSIRGMKNTMDDKAMVKEAQKKTIAAGLRRAQVRALMVEALQTLRDLIPEVTDWNSMIDALPDSITDEEMTEWARGELIKRGVEVEG